LTGISKDIGKENRSFIIIVVVAAMLVLVAALFLFLIRIIVILLLIHTTKLLALTNKQYQTTFKVRKTICNTFFM
jgi:hypothetical protein